MGKDNATSPDEQPGECKAWQWLVYRIADLFPVPDGCLFPDAPEKAKWEVGKSLLSFETDLLRAEKPFRAQIDAAIRAVCAGQSISISPEVRYFLAARARVVRWFLGSFEIDQCGGPPDVDVSQTIIPFPDALPSREIIRWLMFEWWNNNGAEIAALMQLKEMHTDLDPGNS